MCGKPDPYILYNGFNSGMRAAALPQYPQYPQYPHPYFLYSQPAQTGATRGFWNNQQGDLLLDNLLAAIYSTQPYLLTPWPNTIMDYPVAEAGLMAVDTGTAPVVDARDSAYTTSFTPSKTEQNTRPKFFTVSNKPQNQGEHQ